MSGVTVTPIITGWLTLPKEFILEGELGEIRIPIPCFLVEHPKGLLVFDSGLHPAMGKDPEIRFQGKVPFSYEIDGVKPAAEFLASARFDPKAIQYVVNSHLHFDHCGGNETFPDSKILIQRKEIEAARVPELQAQVGYFPHDFETGQSFEIINGEHDIFGDGSVLAVPTPGHTPGHQSLQIHADDARYLLTGDACYLKETLLQGHLPGAVFDRELLTHSLERIIRKFESGYQIIAGHEKECLLEGGLVGIQRQESA